MRDSFSFIDGFRFGCGFMTAAVIAAVVGAFILGILSLILGLFGASFL